jgi:hypothetical protein
MQGELATNQKAFDKEIETLKMVLEKKSRQLEALGPKDKNTA